MKVPASYFSEFHPSIIPTSSTPNPNPPNASYPNQGPDGSQLNDPSTTYTYLHTLETPTSTLRDLLKPDYTSFKAPTNTFVASQHCSSYVYPLQTKDYVAPDLGNGILDFDPNNAAMPSSTWSNNVNKTWTLSDPGLQLYPTGNHLTASILDNQLSNGYQKVCYSCGTNGSSLWSTDANGYHMCNSCCCFRKINHAALRPYVKPQRLSTSKRAGRKCFNCHTEKTSLWRRNNEGEHVCNSCGLYFKMHGYNRPLSMKKETIQTRKRKLKNVNDIKYQPIPMANPATQYNPLDVYDPISASYDVLPPYSSAFVDSPSPTASKPPPPYCPPYDPTVQLDTSIANRCSDLGLTLL